MSLKLMAMLDSAEATVFGDLLLDRRSTLIFNPLSKARCKSSPSLSVHRQLNSCLPKTLKRSIQG